MKIFNLITILFLSINIQAQEVVFEEGLRAFEQTLYPKLRQSCTACHGDGKDEVGHSVSDVRKAYIEAIEFADFNNPLDSIFVRKVRKKHWLKVDSTQQGMTEQEMIDAISAWWEAGEKNAANSYQFKSAENLLPVVLPTMAEGKWLTLNWNLEAVNPILKGCDMKLDIQLAKMADPLFMGSYRVKNPMIRCQGSSFRFTGLQVSVSNEIANFENIYQDSVAQSSLNSDYVSFSNEIMILSQRNLSMPDTVKVLIKTIEAL